MRKKRYFNIFLIVNLYIFCIFILDNQLIISFMKTNLNSAQEQKTEKLTSNSTAMKVEKNGVQTLEPEAPTTKQITEIKNKYPDACIIHKVGDFYLSFGNDAEVVSKTLGTVLTKKGDLPLTGFPVNQIEINLGKLIKSGLKVAVCNKLGEDLNLITPPTQPQPVAEPKQEAKQVKEDESKTIFVTTIPNKTADQKLKDLEKMKILANKYNFLNEKRDNLEKFILSSDGTKEKFTMSNSSSTFEVFNPETLKKILATVLADLNDLTNKTEAELLSFNV